MKHHDPDAVPINSHARKQIEESSDKVAEGSDPEAAAFAAYLVLESLIEDARDAMDEIWLGMTDEQHERLSERGVGQERNVPKARGSDEKKQT